MKLLTLGHASATQHFAEFSVGVQSLPALADHGFQDMVVLPGTFFVEMAASLHRELFNEAPSEFEEIQFFSPVILTGEDAILAVNIAELGSSVEYRFAERAEQKSNKSASSQHSATLRIAGASSQTIADIDSSIFASFQTRAERLISSSEFYNSLTRNRNQYGPAFQRVTSIWRSGDELLAKIAATGLSVNVDTSSRPILLDAATQLLAASVLDQGRTFVLRSIASVEFSGIPAPPGMWGKVQQIEADKESISGDVLLFDDAGRVWASLRGVTITLLDRIQDPDEALTFAIAANFTAEPVEDSLRFWANHFDKTLDVTFAPYNQVFQQLLDPASVLHKNRRGTNIILLSLEEWANEAHSARPHFDHQKAEQSFGARERYVLPNGLQIVHLNAYETDYVYKEIFEDECYLRNGITLQEGATVVDIGANIGLFSLFVMSRFPSSNVYAFEPAPVVYDLLKANAAAYSSTAKAFNLGVSNRCGTAPFTFYENSSVFSGFHSDQTEDREAVQAVVRNMLGRTVVAEESVEDYVHELSSDRLRAVTHECSLTTVSEIIRQNEIHQIDLLKIDAEKSELQVLEGIEEQDWSKIRQIVIEIHESSQISAQQVQDMLSGRGFQCVVTQEQLLQGSGLVNLYATRSGDQPAVSSASAISALEQNIADFSAALQSFTEASAVPGILCLCPRTPSALADPRRMADLVHSEKRLLSAASKIENVTVVTPDALALNYPVSEWHDQQTHLAGHIPYTPEGYAAIGTSLFRTFTRIHRRPFKVIVLDCDNTLWKGVCGEDGLHGVEVTELFRRLQEFMIAQSKAGMLLCLCSKNNEQDVLEVLERRDDMLLKPAHLASWRINWNSKSENVRDLARELNLSLDSFIFLDDNPMEVADVSLNCPGVLALTLPKDTERFPAFLQSVWAFDQSVSTSEDQGRTRMYQENAQREHFREQVVSLREFIAGLQLNVQIDEAAEADIPRISQLTLRTNQFNITTIRRSEVEIRKFLAISSNRCLVVRVADRFGDYGLIGVAMYESASDRYTLDTFLLSCRVLGRGVEHQVLRDLSQRALRDGKSLIEVPFLRTEKNLPALKFLQSLDPADPPERSTWTFSASRIAGLTYVPAENAPQAEPQYDGEAKTSDEKAFRVSRQSERFQKIGEDLYDIQHILQAIDEYRLGVRPSAPGVGDTPQTVLARIWQRVLGRASVGLTENFFEAGGTSLKAVQLVAMIKRELKEVLPIAAVFECPTLKLMSDRLSGKREVQSDNLSSAVLRGRQRRYKVARDTK
jgi:FkbH-like protein/FkbM family methyltransferase